MSAINNPKVNSGIFSARGPRTLAAGAVIVLVAFALRVSFLHDVPPGLFSDEAVNGLDAFRILRTHVFPIFFEANTGREPLFIYLQAVALGLLGSSDFSLRIVPAFAGTLTVAAFVPLAEVLSKNQNRPQLFALIAAAGLAASYSHLNFSRIGLRAILLPLFVVLTFYFFWRARTSTRMRDWVISGVLLGLCLYTYTSARFLPVVYGAFFLTEILARPRVLPVWLRERALMLTAAVLVFIPLGLYFLSEPGAFFARAQDVVIGSGTGLSANLVRVAGMFFVGGDPGWRHNLSGRPVLDWIGVLPFLAGALTSFVRWKQPATRLVWIWLGVMLLPSVLSQGAPDTLRTIGALPAIYLVVAWGWDALLRSVARLASNIQSVASLAALGLTLLGSGWITSQDYFVRWANDRHTFNDFEGGTNDLANWLNRAPPPIYLPLELYAHPTIQFLTAPRFGRMAVLTDAPELLRSQAWAIVPDDRSASGAFVLLREGQVILLNPAFLPGLIGIDSVPGRRGPVATLARVAGNPFDLTQPTPVIALNAKFENELTLLGYGVTRSQGDRLDVTLYWRAERSPMREPKVFVHLLDENGAIVAQVDELLTGGISVLDWSPGEMVPDRHVLPLNKNKPPADLRLEIGLSDLFGGDRLNVTLGDGTSDDRVLVGPLVLPPP